jgi:hypothetical protein
MSAISLILHEIFQERQRQDEQWGGPEHDDQHIDDDWIALLRRRIDRADVDLNVNGDHDSYRKRLIQVAALAVAATEAYDRQVERKR